MVWRCDFCVGKVWKNELSFRQHVRDHHSNRCFKCTLCNKMYNRHHVALRHLWKCKLCNGKAYRSLMSLKQHERDQHSNMYFQCVVCRRTFGRHANATRHLMQVWTCKLCRGRHYSSRLSLMQHHRDHHANRKFQCVVCKHMYLRHSVAQRHLLQVHKVTDKSEIKKKIILCLDK